MKTFLLVCIIHRDCFKRPSGRCDQIVFKSPEHPNTPNHRQMSYLHFSFIVKSFKEKYVILDRNFLLFLKCLCTYMAWFLCICERERERKMRVIVLSAGVTWRGNIKWRSSIISNGNTLHFLQTHTQKIYWNTYTTRPSNFNAATNSSS